MDSHEWETFYLSTPASELPWNAGKPESDLVRLVTSGEIPKGQALDLGTGPGHDAVFLLQQGFDVIGIDISPSAITLARENASHHGLFGYFQVGDIRELPIEDGYIDFVHDRGCFHVLTEEDRPRAISEIARVLRPKGRMLLRVSSEKSSTQEIPYGFTRAELEALWTPRFRILEFWDGVFEGSRQRKAHALLMEKRP